MSRGERGPRGDHGQTGPAGPQHRLPERWYRDVWLFVITAVVAVALLGFKDQVDKNAANARAIQAQRVDSLARACKEQNARHDGTIAALDRGIAALPPGRRKRQAQARRDFTVRLIDALAPKQNCRRRVRELVPPVSPGGTIPAPQGPTTYREPFAPPAARLAPP